MNEIMEWATVETPCAIVLSTSCECEDEPSGCDGSVCYEPIKEDLEDNIFPEFLKRNNSPSYLKIEGKAMGWQRRSGYKIIEANFNALFDSLTFSGDWTLKITLAGDSLTIVRSSHDEPTGATFTIEPSTEEEAA
jgi:hypothetical protein